MSLQSWFESYTPREQLYLLAAAGALGLYLLFVGLWRPLDTARDEMATRSALAAEQLARVRLMASELKQLEAAGGEAPQRNLNRLINSTTNAFGIRPSRIQPNSRGEVQVRFEDVGFAEIMRWLHQLESLDGIRVREVSINQGGRGGIVQATVRLGQGA